MLDMITRTAHPVTIYTPREVIAASLMVPTAIRFSSWLGNQEATIAAKVQINGAERDILLNRPYLEAVIDEVPPYTERSEVRPGTPTRIAVAFESGLRIEGGLHLSAEAQFDANIRFGGENALRVLTDATVSYQGKPVREGATALINLARAVYVARL